MLKIKLVVLIAKQLAIYERILTTAFEIEAALVQDDSFLSIVAYELLDAILDLAGVPAESDDFSRDWWYEATTLSDEREPYIPWGQDAANDEAYIKLAGLLIYVPTEIN